MKVIFTIVALLFWLSSSGQHRPTIRPYLPHHNQVKILYMWQAGFLVKKSGDTLRGILRWRPGKHRIMYIAKPDQKKEEKLPFNEVESVKYLKADPSAVSTGHTDYVRLPGIDGFCRRLIAGKVSLYDKNFSCTENPGQIDHPYILVSGDRVITISSQIMERLVENINSLFGQHFAVSDFPDERHAVQWIKVHAND